MWGKNRKRKVLCTIRVDLHSFDKNILSFQICLEVVIFLFSPFTWQFILLVRKYALEIKRFYQFMLAHSSHVFLTIKTIPKEKTL